MKGRLEYQYGNEDNRFAGPWPANNNNQVIPLNGPGVLVTDVFEHYIRHPSKKEPVPIGDHAFPIPVPVPIMSNEQKRMINQVINSRSNSNKPNNPNVKSSNINTRNRTDSVNKTLRRSSGSLLKSKEVTPEKRLSIQTSNQDFSNQKPIASKTPENIKKNSIASSNIAERKRSSLLSNVDKIKRSSLTSNIDKNKRLSSSIIDKTILKPINKTKIEEYNFKKSSNDKVPVVPNIPNCDNVHNQLDNSCCYVVPNNPSEPNYGPIYNPREISQERITRANLRENNTNIVTSIPNMNRQFTSGIKPSTLSSNKEINSVKNSLVNSYKNANNQLDYEMYHRPMNCLPNKNELYKYNCLNPSFPNVKNCMDPSTLLTYYSDTSYIDDMLYNNQEYDEPTPEEVFKPVMYETIIYPPGYFEYKEQLEELRHLYKQQEEQSMTSCFPNHCYPNYNNNLQIIGYDEANNPYVNVEKTRNCSLFRPTKKTSEYHYSNQNKIFVKTSNTSIHRDRLRENGFC